MNGNDLAAMNPEKGWFREGRHGREVTVDYIRVEPIQNPDKAGDVKYRMTAVIDGERVSHDISKREYDKFMAVDDLHRMKLFSKVFSEVDMKNRYPVGFGTKLTAAFAGRGYRDARGDAWFASYAGGVCRRTPWRTSRAECLLQTRSGQPGGCSRPTIRCNGEQSAWSARTGHRHVRIWQT
jgi:hypothetical protein